MEKDTEDYVMQLEKRIVFLEGRVALLEAQLNASKPVPTQSPSWILTADSDARSKWPALESHLNTNEIKPYINTSRDDLDL